MPRVTMPFGQGLDRETGVMAVRPGTFEDLRNLLLHQGKLVVRPGFDEQLTLEDDEGNAVTHVLQGFALRSERVGVVVSYSSSTQKVWVHRTDSEGTIAELIGEWENDTGWGSTPPKVSMAEVYGRVFMAHDTRVITRRAKTIYYDPIFGTSPLADLEGDFEGTGTHDIRFRGVVRHLKYLVGWGYGDEGEDRPELVRVSAAGDPTTFAPNHYFIAGDRRDPVLRCAPAGGRLMVLKETEGHYVFGSGRDDFGIDLLDPLHGILSSGLAANYGGLLLAWGSEGPRVWDGAGPSQEIAIPLDLGGLEPAGLVTAGEASRGFAHYIPELRVAVFVFGRRVYGLTMRVEGDWKWSYWELGFEPYCAFTLYPGEQATTAPEGYPEYTSETPAGTYVDITWTNRQQQGDETLEVWLKPDGGSWALAKSTVVSTATTQVTRLEGLTPGTDYEVAGRYRRGVLYHPAYEDADPAAWPAISQGAFTTTLDPPTFVSAVWSRTGASTEQITLTVTPAAGQEAQDIDVKRDGSVVGTISGPHAGDATYDDTGISGETMEQYEFVTKGGSGDSPDSDAVFIWAGPTPPPSIDWTLSTYESYEVGIIPGDVSWETEVHDDYDNAGGLGSEALRVTVAAGVTFAESGALANVPAAPGLDATVRLRHKVTTFGTDDFTQFSAGEEVHLEESP